MEIRLSWSQFKAITAGKNLRIQYYTGISGEYYIFSAEGNIVYYARILSTDTSDKNDFETNYKDIVTNQKSNSVVYEPATFVCYTSQVASANNKSMVSLMNGSTSDVVRVHAIKLVNTRTASVVGVFLDYALQRITGHSGGVLETIVPYDTADTLDAGITARTGATVSGESATWMNALKISSEELSPTTGLSNPVMGQIAQMHSSEGLLTPMPNAKPLVLRPGEGIHAHCWTNSTTARINAYIFFTVE